MTAGPSLMRDGGHDLWLTGHVPITWCHFVTCDVIAIAGL